jgi:hypothetical protein
MSLKKMARLLPLLFAIPLLAIGLFYVPAEFPCRIEMSGKIVPHREWFLIRGEDGQMVSTLRDHLRGTVDGFEVATFERADRVAFKRHSLFIPGTAIAAGDTVGKIDSRELERQWKQLRGELTVELAALEMDSAGDEPAALREARLELDYARLQETYQEKQVERVNALLQREVATPIELETAENALALSGIRIDIAAAQLKIASTGAREQEQDWRRARIEALRDELKLFAARLEDAVITAPLNGRIAAVASGDTLAAIQDTASYVILLPARWSDRGYLAPGQQIEIQVDGRQETITGAIKELGHTAFAFNGKQFFKVKAIITDDCGQLAPGLVVRCSISTDPLEPWEFVQREFAL